MMIHGSTKDNKKWRIELNLGLRRRTKRLSEKRNELQTSPFSSNRFLREANQKLFIFGFFYACHRVFLRKQNFFFFLMNFNGGKERRIDWIDRIQRIP